MGLFDYITYKGLEYQTKSFECEMRRYTIERDNTVLVQDIGGSGEYGPMISSDLHGYGVVYSCGDGKIHYYKMKFTDGRFMHITDLGE